MQAVRCKVRGCRNALFHTTAGHKCGKCGEHGHGRIECGSQEKRDALTRYHSDTVPAPCQVDGCSHPSLHITEGHLCPRCLLFGCSSCTFMRKECTSMRCPTCRTVQWSSNFQLCFVNGSCAVCLGSDVRLCISTVCKHALCEACLPAVACSAG